MNDLRRISVTTVWYNLCTSDRNKGSYWHRNKLW